jgi:hypothetical protein
MGNTDSQSATAIFRQLRNALVEEMRAFVGAPLAGSSLGVTATSYRGAADPSRSTDATFVSAVVLPAASATN